ncbi:T9SS type A sorting domain-containing protein [Membranicola marinus]|uniref:T9SS type A sorting domain-containing protein n=1 Tax=Membranihabitans marinus TaxID=1227546 RepID=A0A953LA98_9BACT|nr:T9SS type A sorting domain-containing protein [Membranihabitans marinus]MBY5959700.1 T9SS type A sorting domain-containing protein [Membranihabitans marinus]
MSHHFSILFLLIFFLFARKVLHAQQAVVTAGASLSHSTGSISYSVGLIPFKRYDTSSGSLTEGLFHIYRVKTFRAADGIKPSHVTIFPNPTPDWINIRMDNHSADPMTAVLSDIKGRTMTTIKLQDHHEGRLSLHKYKSGVYFLSIRKGSAPLETFKIIKL